MKKTLLKKTYFFIFSILFINGFSVFSQDIANIKNNKPITVTGGVGANVGLYDAVNMSSRRDPYNYTVNGNVNINFYGILDLPFSFYYSKQNTTYKQPSFQFFGVSPRYKYVTLHAGYRSMQFSQYTLSGIQFLGVGLEVQPEKSFVRCKMMYGRLSKAVPVGDTLHPQLLSPTFERWGMGSMITLGSYNNNVDLIVFKASDKPTMLGLGTDTLLKPQENLMLGINTKQQVGKRITVSAEYALSAYTLDTRMPLMKFETYTYANNLGNVYKPRYSSTFNNAYNVKATFQGNGFTLGGAYSRIDPGFQSMGTSYITNDIEDYQANASTALFKNKLSLSGTLGLQYNNLEKQLSTQNKRNIYGINISVNATKRLNCTFNYSNFSSSISARQIIVGDSIKYMQVTQNIVGGINYNIPGEVYKHSVSVNVSSQIANTINNELTEVMHTGTLMNNQNAGYRITYVPYELGFNTAFSNTQYIVDTLITHNYGPVIGISKMFFKKTLTSNVSYSFLTSGSNLKTKNDSYVNVIRIMLSYRLGKHHSFSANGNILAKNAPDIKTSDTARKHSKEFMGTFSYNYTF